MSSRYQIRMIEDLDFPGSTPLYEEPQTTTWSAEGELSAAIFACTKILAYWPERYVCGWVYDSELNCRCSPIFRQG